MGVLDDRRRARGIQIYDPVGERAAAARQQQRAMIPRPPVPQATGTAADRVRAALAKPSPKEEEEDGGGNPFGRGLGFLINNPVTQVALKPLEYLDYGRRAVTLGLEEFAEGITGQELEAQKGDTRSNWDKLNDPTYGVGQLLGGTVGDITPWEWDDKWVDRAAGLVGDIALDPLSYVTGIGGVVSKGGGAVNAANRAAMGARALDLGLDATDVSKFIRRGAGAVDDDFLRALDLERSGVRMGLNPLSPRGPQFTVPGTRTAGRVINKAGGAAADRLRNTRPGAAVQRLRTPKQLESSYDALFRGKGPYTMRTAANRVAIDTVNRTAQNTFKQMSDEASKELRKKLKRLDRQSQEILVGAVENGTKLADSKLDGLRSEYAEFLSELLTEAQKAGLNARRRRNYSPHILTRDAAKWLRNSTDQAATNIREASGLVTVDLFDPSGVTMARQFQPGQTIEVNGLPVTFEAGKPITVADVNKKFKDAGLKFDFYETDPSVILEKYMDMISSDVGQAQGILSRAGGGSVAQLTDDEMRMLGRGIYAGDNTGVTVRGSGDLADSDIDEIRRVLNAPRAEGAPEVLAAQKQQTRVLDTTKDGKPKLTKVGRAKKKRGVPMSEMDPETDFRWKKELRDETKEYNKGVTEQATRMRRQAEIQGDQALSDVDVALSQAAGGVTGELTKSFKEAMASATAARRRVIELINDTANRGLRGQELEARIAQIDDVMEQIANDIPAMDAALARAQDAAESLAIRQERDALVKEYERLTKQIQDLARGMDSNRAKFLTEEADRLAAEAQAPVAQAREAYDAAREAAAERVGLNHAIQAREQTLSDLAYAEARQRGGVLPANAGEAVSDRIRPPAGTADSIRGRLRRIDDEIKRLTKEVDADIPTAAAKRRLDQAEARLARQPSTLNKGKTPNVKPEKVAATPDDLLFGTSRGKKVLELDDEVLKVGEEIQDLTVKVNGAEQTLAKTSEMVERSNAMTAAKRKFADAKALGDKKAMAAADAEIVNIRRSERARLGYNEDAADLELLRQKLNQAQSRMRQYEGIIRDIGDRGYSPEQLQEIRRVMARNVDPGVQGEVQRLRTQASEAAGAGSRVIPDLTQQRASIGEDIVGIARDPDVRAAYTERGVDRLTEPVRRAQEKPRAAAQAAQEFSGKLTGRRKAYVDELAKINENIANDYRLMDEALTSRQVAEEVQAKSQELVRRANQQLYGGVDEAGNPTLLRTPSNAAPSGLDAYDSSVAYNVETLKQILDSSDLPEDVRTATEVLLNSAIETAEEFKKLDLSQKRYNELIAAGKRGELGRVVEATLADGWSAPYPHLIGDNVVMADELHQMFEEVRTAAFHKDFWPVIDTFTNLFKTYATLTPGFHVRNAMSAAFMNATEGVPMTTQLRGARLMSQFRRAKDPVAWMEKEGSKVLNKQTNLTVRDAFEAAFGTGIGGRYTERGIGQRGSMGNKLTEKMFSNKLTETLGKGMGGFVEGSVRLPVAMHTIINGGNVEEALNRITRIHFDYSQVSRFDETMKRFIPFWTFMSRNLPMQFTQMWTKPRTYAKYNSFIRNVRGEDEPGTPGYFGEVGAFRVGDETLGGLPLYLQPDFAHTRLEEDISKIENLLSGENPARVLSDFNPLFTAPAEFAFNQDLYTGRRYDQNTDFRKTGLLETPIALLGGILGQNVTSPGGQTATYEKFLNAMRAINPMYDRAVRLAPGATTGDASEDAVNRQLESYLRFLGVPVRQLSPQQQQATLRGDFYDTTNDQRRQRALAQLDT